MNNSIRKDNLTDVITQLNTSSPTQTNQTVSTPSKDLNYPKNSATTAISSDGMRITLIDSGADLIKTS